MKLVASYIINANFVCKNSFRHAWFPNYSEGGTTRANKQLKNESK